MKGRINLGPDSTGAAEPRERVVSVWISLVRKKLLLQGIPIEETNINAANPGKMCKVCFANFQRFYKLQVQLEENLMVALRKMSFTHSPAANILIEPQILQRPTPDPQSLHHLTPIPRASHYLTPDPPGTHHRTPSPQAPHNLTEAPHHLSLDPQAMHDLTPDLQTLRYPSLDPQSQHYTTPTPQEQQHTTPSAQEQQHTTSPAQEEQHTTPPAQELQHTTPPTTPRPKRICLTAPSTSAATSPPVSVSSCYVHEIKK